MIDVLQSRAHVSRHLWAGTIQRLLQTLDLQDRPAVPDISEGLAVFCQEHAHIPDHILFILIAHSFCVFGDTEAAEQILRQNRLYGRYADSWVTILSVEHPFPDLYPLLIARALRPLELNSAGRAWVLDFERVSWATAERCELLVFQIVRGLTEKVSSVWTHSSGRGVLGVKGLSSFSGDSRPRSARMSAQLLDHLHDVLARCARNNGWDYCPSVLQMEL